MFIANSNLILLLDSFSKNDIKEFRKMIICNFFSRGRNYLSLFNQLLKFKKKGFSNLTPQKLYSKLYPGKNFSMQTLNNRFSELFKLAEEYLIHRTLKENIAEKNKLLLLAYHNNMLDKLFQRQFKKSRSFINTTPESDSKYFDIIFLSKMNISYAHEQVISEKTFKYYFEQSEYMAAMFLKNMFEFGFEFKQQEQTNRKYEFNLVQEILDRLEVDDALIKNLLKSNSKIFKILVMEYFFYDIFKNPENEKNYFEARRIFEELKATLDENYSTELYKKMTNYCIMRQNQGIKKFQPELFKLYNEKLKLGIYLDNKKVFPSTTFRNYVLIGIILKKLKWTENFINKYSNELPEENRDDEIKLSYSKLFFSDKNYVRSLQYLKGFKGLNYLHYCDSSILKLCTFYETKNFEEAFSGIDKFRHYLRNHNEIPKIHKEYCLNFLKIYQLLIKITTGVDKKELYVIENLIKEIRPVSRESWLEEKIKELGKGNY
ncbi:MAG: hypothetical protein M3R36_18005 [Bacteroidota bacterium]|nr:hypothetical protein [Bacteroidota bacterium]